MKTRSFEPKTLALYIILILGAFSASIPFLWMVSTSFKSSDMLFVFPPQFIPDVVTTGNYTEVFNSFPMLKFLGNSVFVAVVTTTGQILLCSMAGYAFAKIDFKFKEALFIIYLATLMVPKQVTMTPLFILMTKLNLANTYRALILPELFSAFGTFFLCVSSLEISQTVLRNLLIWMGGQQHSKYFLGLCCH